MSWSWSWDETLYAGSAEHYAAGRLPYPAALGTALRDALDLDGAGRLLDVGCGPGSLTTLLAPYFAAAVGADADPGMIEVARRRAPGITWLHARAEELPAGLGTFRCVTFAQSFHWMDQPLVARRIRPVIEPGGAWVHVGATTHQGGTTDVPWEAIAALVAGFLGPVRRAGRGQLPDGTRSGEDDVMRAAGYRGRVQVDVPWDETVQRPADSVVSAVYSLSWAAPHLFGDRLDAFERELRELLGERVFTERMGRIAATIWRP